MSTPHFDAITRDAGLFLTIRLDDGLLDAAMLDALDDAIEQADLDVSISCVVMRIAQAAREHPAPPPGPLPGDLIARRVRLDASIAAARRVPKLLVIVHDGILTGEAIGLLSVADVVLASHLSVLKPGPVPEALLGMVPALARSHGGIRAALLGLLEGRDLDAHAARQCGLVTDVMPAERLEPVIEGLLRSIAKAGPTAVAMLKAASCGGA